MELTNLSLTELRDALAKGECSSVELTQAYLDRIAEQDTGLHAYLTVAKEEALQAAKASDDKRAAGESTPLLGIPIALKDNLSTVGIRTTAASKILEHFEPAYDATVVKKIKEAGGFVLGKTNLDEWGHGASTENSAYGVTKNPWDTERVSGGSSGGSAAAVAASMCAGALGTDTGGSVRYPAGFCGVVGLRPSYGLVSRSGLLSMTSSTDVVGSLTKTVSDAALLLDVIAGVDANDQTTSPIDLKSNQFFEAATIRSDLKGVRIGVPRDFVEREGVTAEVNQAFAEALAVMQGQGAEIVDITLPHAHYGISAYYIITPSEVSSNLARFDGIRYGKRAEDAKTLHEVYTKSRGQGLGAEPKRRIMLGTYALSAGYYDAYYLTAQKVRTVITKELEEVLKTVEVIATPTAPHAAFKIGSQSDDPLKMYLEDIFMSPAALAGLPAVSVPAGFVQPAGVSKKLPVGMQFVGKRFGDGEMLGVARAYEQATDWCNQRPT